MNGLKEIRESLLHVFFPHTCLGCGSDAISDDNNLCMSCLASFPSTYFHLHANNPMEKKFWGRVPLVSATAQYYFTPGSVIQRLMHQVKYNGKKDLGLQLGRLMGSELVQTHRFCHIDALVPLPLFPRKEKARGYNQATLLCEGMAEVMQKELLPRAVRRRQHTETQTKKGRLERWENMEGKFELVDPQAIKGMHLLLVDDIITTGATLEACAHELLKAEDTRVSLACFSYTAQ